MIFSSKDYKIRMIILHACSGDRVELSILKRGLGGRGIFVKSICIPAQDPFKCLWSYFIGIPSVL